MNNNSENHFNPAVLIGRDKSPVSILLMALPVIYKISNFCYDIYSPYKYVVVLISTFKKQIKFDRLMP